MHATDLAPGDGRSLDRDWSDIILHEIRSVDDPAFTVAYDTLWHEFGACGEVETREVLAQRLLWTGTPHEGCLFDYRLHLVTSNGEPIAVVDHTIMIPGEARGALVHVSHLLVAPAWRRSGLAGWMRALPVRDARQTLAASGRPTDAPILLAAEVEHLDPANPATATRLKAFGKAGYMLADPKRVHFLQPDFRPPDEIDREGVTRPVPLTLVFRRVGHEDDGTMTGGEIRLLVSTLYTMYAATFRPQDMQPLWDSLKDYPLDDEPVALIPPYCLS